MALFRRDVLQAAEKLVSKGKVEAAVKEYLRYLQRSPEDTNTLNRVGDLYARLRKNDEAIAYYKQTAERFSADGFYVKGIAVYKKIHRLEPGRVDIHERLAELYQRQGLISDARGHYHQLADHFLRDDKPVAAIGVFEKLAELEPENPSHWLRLADLHREQGQLRQALRAYGSIGTLMLSHGQTDHAFQVYERAFQVDPADLDFVSDAVAALKEVAGEGRASELLAVAVAHNPEAQRLQSLVSTGQRPALAPEDTASQRLVEEPVPTAPVGPPAAQQAAAERMPPAAAAPPEEPVPLAAPPAAAQTPAAQPAPSTPSPAAAPGAARGGLSVDSQPELGDLDLEIEIEIDPVGPLPRAESDEFELIDEPPAAVAPGSRPAVAAESDEDLLSEADVFIKYGLAEKAIDRLTELLGTHPGHLGALTRLVGLHVERNEHETAIERATEIYSSTDGGLDEAWVTAEGQLLAAGYRIEGGAISWSEPVEESVPQSTVTEVEADALAGVTPEEAAPDLVAGVLAIDDLRPAEIDVQPFSLGLEDGELDLVAPEIEMQPDSEIAQPPVEDVPPEAEPVMAAEEAVDLAESPEAVDHEPEATEQPQVQEAQVQAPQPQEAQPQEAQPQEPQLQESQPFVAVTEDTSESGVTPEWLEEVDEVSAEEEGERLFAEEDAFFDLAAELQGALAEGEPEESEEAEPTVPSEQSLEQIVEGFKRGVAENISDEESDTHYNLGIAYREMMLLDEAIGEFQISAKDPGYMVDSCAMLGLCFRDKGLADLAVKWYRKALDSAGIGEEQRLGMLYDLGATYEMMDDSTAAYNAYVEIYGANTNYRDVSEKVEQLSG